MQQPALSRLQYGSYGHYDEQFALTRLAPSRNSGVCIPVQHLPPTRLQFQHPPDVDDDQPPFTQQAKRSRDIEAELAELDELLLKRPSV